MYVHLVCGGCAVRGPRSVIGALTLPDLKNMVVKTSSQIHLSNLPAFHSDGFMVQV